MASAYQCFASKWSNGCGSSICCEESKVVLARGTIPCDIVLVGEAPGESENVIGKPFVGPAGKLLDSIIERSLGSFADVQIDDRGSDVVCPRFSYAMTNLVCCIPREEDGGKSTAPSDKDIKQCAPRLVEFVRLCKPRLVVLVGTLAKKYVYGQAQFNPVDWLPKGDFLRFVEIAHPAYLIRLNVAQRGLAIQKAAVTLTTAVEELIQ